MLSGGPAKKVNMSDGRGPVEIIFAKKAGVDIKYLSFSQRRHKGFRNQSELDHKRVLVADKFTINVFGYKNQPKFR